jgi:hypothetical protein
LSPLIGRPSTHAAIGTFALAIDLGEGRAVAGVAEEQVEYCPDE